MVTVMFMSVALVAILCVIARNLAVYALLFMPGLAAARFAYKTGVRLVGAGLVASFLPAPPLASWPGCSRRSALPASA